MADLQHRVSGILVTETGLSCRVRFAGGKTVVDVFRASTLRGKLILSAAEAESLGFPAAPATPSPQTKRIGIDLTSAQCTPETAAWMKAQGINSVTARWEMKWNPMLNPAGASRIAGFCRDNGFSLRLHAGIWHVELPGNLPGDREGMTTAIEQRMRSLVSMGIGIPDVRCDVANELFNNGGSLRSYAVTDAFGGDVLAMMRVACRAARVADPKCKLVYNDYGLIEWPDPGKSDTIFGLCAQLHSEGLLDGVGCQYHPDNEGGQPSVAGLSNEFKRYHDIGMFYEITEMGIPQANPVRFQNVFTANPDHITFWGGRDNWADVSGGPSSPSQPWDSQGTAKPSIVGPLLTWSRS